MNKVVARVAAGVAGGAVLAITAPTSASAAPIEQWWADAYRLDQVHQTTQGDGAVVCVIDGAINADVPEFDGADLRLKSAVTAGDDDTLVAAKSYPSAFYAAHGTSMTSLIIGQGKGTGPGGAGIAGMAPKATVYFYQDDEDPTVDKADVPGYEYNLKTYDLLIDRGLDDGCKIFSISVTNATVSLETLRRVNAENAVVLWGGPNVSRDSEVDGTLVVGAADRDSKAWNDDEQPASPDVIAPGVDIISGATKGTATDARWVSDVSNSGSSDATAITAGMLALVSSKYPDATGNQLIQSLIHSVGGKEFWGARSDWGWGPTNLADMLARDPSGWPDVNPMLMTRQEVFETFPESVWKDPGASATTDEQGSTDDVDRAAGDQGSEGGLPGWALVGGGLVLVGAAGTAVLVARNRRTTPSTADQSGA